jgi:hypothetical protein
MKVSELKNLIEGMLTQEVKSRILAESEGNKKDFYHITCEGVPLATFESEKEAEDALPDYKAKHKGELIIEKGEYNSHEDMMNKLDEMNDQLEEENEMQPEEGNAFSGALAKAKEAGDDEFTVDGNEYDVNEDDCMECGGGYMDEHDSNLGEAEMCECGGMINEEGCCSECGQQRGMYEESVRVKNLIKNIVTESIPGLRAAEKAHKESGKENKSAISDIEKKISKALSFDGNDNPEFPKQIGKGEKVARKNTKAQEEEIAKNFAGLENLDFDVEPSEEFKKRLKMAIEGDRLMGNAPTTEKTNIVASNGAKAEAADENKDGNTIPTPETAKKIEKQVKDREKDKKERVVYKKESVPTEKKSVNESEFKNANVLNEINKIKNIASYNKKTQ